MYNSTGYCSWRWWWLGLPRWRWRLQRGTCSRLERLWFGEGVPWRARAHTHACVYAYLGGFKVIMEANFVIPGRDLTRNTLIKGTKRLLEVIPLQCFAHCAGSWLSVSFCLCYQYHIVERPKEQGGKIIYQILPATAERWQRNAPAFI